ncbi:condensation domain-containing protein [Krasilnikovia sp. MM14-A1004]|uniref:condensation domain-containing protein n=1 Tax=Krasilnikovia sp. MM14-A1004 TaxID=3373541 RepID=UPI00399CA1C4
MVIRDVIDAGAGQAPGRATPAGTPEQDTLARVWARVLGVDEIGLDDDFFVLGGDSLMAIKAIVEAEKHGIPIGLTDLFERPTIRQLVAGGGPARPAAHSGPAASGLLSPDDLDRLPAQVERAYPASMLQEGLIFEGIAQDESLYHDVISRRIMLSYDESAMRRALDMLADRHESLRTSINLSDYSAVLQLVARSATIPLRSTDSTGQHAAQPLRSDLAYASEPFDVEHGPLLRVAVTVLSDDAFQITYGFHHAIMDGWSDTVFITELIDSYAALRSGRQPEPAGSRPDMAEFVRLEREAVDSPVSREYWTSRTRDLPAVAEPEQRSSARHRVSVSVAADRWRQVTDFAAAQRVPVKSVLLAAHLAARHARDGAAVPVTGLVCNGRVEEAGGDEMIGLFLNVVPIAVAVCRDGGTFVRRVRQAEQDLFPHRRFPYAEIKRMNGRHLYDATFNYVHFRLEQRLHTSGVMPHGSREIHDKVSFPLIIDAVQNPDGTGLRLDFSADPARWPSDELAALAELHRTTLERLVTGEPVAGADHG